MVEKAKKTEETKKKTQTVKKPTEKIPVKKTTPKKQETKTTEQKKKTSIKKEVKETPIKKEIKKTKKEETPTEEEPREKKTVKPKKKPVLSEELKQKLEKRKEIKKRTPNFLREEWFRYKRIPQNWRRPDGITSKMRRNLAYRPSKVRVGFRGPKETRGLHSSGFQEVTVFNVKDLEGINPKTQAARIGGTVGTKKRIDIEKKAKELDIRLLNLNL
jgi:large subunit ribosomal protein L32e